jgi:TetR/AcrR family transcriptional regulator
MTRTPQTHASVANEPMPLGTEERILDSALTEFAHRGFAGARVDKIAEGAKANVASLYRYFGNKEDLYQVILDLGRREGERLGAAAPRGLNDRLEYYAKAMVSGRWRQLLRVRQWAELEGRASNTPGLRTSREVDGIRREQEEGKLDPEFDPQFLYLFETALFVFPQLMPMWTQDITGIDPQSPEYLGEFQRFLSSLARVLTATDPAASSS